MTSTIHHPRDAATARRWGYDPSKYDHGSLNDHEPRRHHAAALYESYTVSGHFPARFEKALEPR